MNEKPKDKKKDTVQKESLFVPLRGIQSGQATPADPSRSAPVSAQGTEKKRTLDPKFFLGKVDELKFLKEKLSQDKNAKEDKKQKLESLKNQLNQQKASLASQRNSKKSLLNHTKGEEKKYQEMLANIEAQKKSLLGDINRLLQQKSVELARLKESLPKPPSQYWASENWYYKQNDSRWENVTIGISNSTLGDYGCAITSVAMVLSYHGSWINPAQLAKEDIFSTDVDGTNNVVESAKQLAQQPFLALPESSHSPESAR